MAMPLIRQWIRRARQDTRAHAQQVLARDPGFTWDETQADADAGMLFEPLRRECPNGACGAAYVATAAEMLLDGGLM
jgi:hypothetical protein